MTIVLLIKRTNNARRPRQSIKARCNAKSQQTQIRTQNSHHHINRREATAIMSNTEVACSQEATQVLDERRLNKMSYSNDITSRQELLILIKVLLNELEEKDPSKRAKTVRVRTDRLYGLLPFIITFFTCSDAVKHCGYSTLMSHTIFISFVSP